MTEQKDISELKSRVANIKMIVDATRFQPRSPVEDMLIEAIANLARAIDILVDQHGDFK